MPSDAKKKREQKKKEAAKGKNKKTTKENGDGLTPLALKSFTQR